MHADAPLTGYVALLGMAAGCLLALAGAVALSLGRHRSLEKLAHLITPFFGLAVLLMGLALLLIGLSGPTTWLEPLAFAGISFLLLAGLIHRPSQRKAAGFVLDLALAWLAVAAGICSLVILGMG